MTANPEAIRAAFAKAMKGAATVRRHPADVTADRLIDAAGRYSDSLSGREKDAFGEVINALREIAGGER